MWDRHWGSSQESRQVRWASQGSAGRRRAHARTLQLYERRMRHLNCERAMRRQNYVHTVSGVMRCESLHPPSGSSWLATLQGRASAKVLSPWCPGFPTSFPPALTFRPTNVLLWLPAVLADWADRRRGAALERLERLAARRDPWGFAPSLLIFHRSLG